MVGNEEGDSCGDLALDAIVDSHGVEGEVGTVLEPLGALFEGEAAAAEDGGQPHTGKGDEAAREAEGEDEPAEESACGSGCDARLRRGGHEVSGARNRFRAEEVMARRSISVRKSMVPNSRSQAGALAMRAPIAR